MKRLVFALFLTGLLAAISISSWETDKDSYEPGDSGFITLHISLTHNLATGERLIRFNYVRIQSTSSIVNIDKVLGDMDENEITVSIPFSISNDINEGIYSITVDVSGIAEIESYGKTKEEIDTASTLIPLKVVKQPVITLSVEPRTLGKSGSLTLHVCNKKGIARNVEITSENLHIEGGLAFINELRGCRNMSVDYDASGLNEGVNQVSFTITYKDFVGDEHVSSLTIPITISKDETHFVLRQEGVIKHKTNDKLYLYIQNKGQRADDVRIKALGDISFLSSNEIDAGTLEKGEEKEVEVEAYTSLLPGVNKVSFLITWKEEGKLKEETVEVPITVESEDSIEVYLEANPVPLIKGKESTLSVVVANKASYSMSGVSVSIDSNAFEVLEVEKRRFIGSLESDDFSSQQFRIRIKNSAKDEDIVNITIHYKDPSGKEHVKKVEIPINVKESEQKDYPVVEVLVGIAVIGVIYFVYRKRK